MSKNTNLLITFLLLTSFCYIVRGSQELDVIESTDEKANERIDERSRSRVQDVGKIVKENNNNNNKIVTHGTLFLNRLQHDRKEHLKKDNKLNVKANTIKEKSNDLLRGRPRRKKRRRRNRALMALLLAYKMKFMALIPTLLGGFILLIGKALLAGFFFALFATVLSLKTH